MPKIDLIRHVTKMQQTINNQYAIQQKIFQMLNSYSKGDHMQQFTRVDPQSILAEVYMLLAQNFLELQSMITEDVVEVDPNKAGI